MFSSYGEVILVTYIALLGALLVRQPTQSIWRLAYLFTVAFPLGYVLVASTAMMSVVALSHFNSSVALGFPLAIVLCARFFGRGAAAQFSSRKDITIVLCAYFVTSAILRYLNPVIFSYDSYNFAILGGALAGGFPLTDFAGKFSGHSIFPTIFHALCHIVGQDYGSSFSPLFVLCGSTGVLYFSKQRLDICSLRGGVLSWLACSLAIIFVAYCYFVQQQTFYVNGHTANGALFLIATLELVAMKNGLRGGDRASWHSTSILFILLLGITVGRIEGLLGLMLLLILAADTGKLSGRQLLLGVAIILSIRCAWSWKLFSVLRAKEYVSSPTRLMLMSVPPLMVAAFYALPIARRTIPWWRVATLLAISFGLVVCCVLKSPTYSITAMSLVSNLTTSVPWGALWPMTVLFLIFGARTRREQGEEFVRFVIVSYVGLILLMSYARSFRVGWQDSANRMMVHLVPLATYLFASTVIEAFSRKRESSTGQPPPNEALPGLHL